MRYCFFFLFIFSMKINRKQHASSIDNLVCTHSWKVTTIHGKLRFAHEQFLKGIDLKLNLFVIYSYWKDCKAL